MQKELDDIMETGKHEHSKNTVLEFGTVKRVLDKNYGKSDQI